MAQGDGKRPVGWRRADGCCSTSKVTSVTLGGPLISGLRQFVHSYRVPGQQRTGHGTAPSCSAYTQKLVIGSCSSPTDGRGQARAQRLLGSEEHQGRITVGGFLSHHVAGLGERHKPACVTVNPADRCLMVSLLAHQGYCCQLEGKHRKRNTAAPDSSHSGGVISRLIRWGSSLE